MLSRVGDALFWMSRYLERAEHMARAVDVTFQFTLDLHGVLSGPVELEWNALLALLRMPPPPPSGGTTATSIPRWVLVDPRNAGNVLACVNRSRTNARSIRGSISPLMWRELNKLHWRLAEPAFQARVVESPHDFCEETRIGVLLFHGVSESSLMHDEGWHFIQLGRSIERAEKVLRILESSAALLDATDPADLPMAGLRWAAALRHCAAYEAYRRLTISRVEPERVVEFLLMNPDFPQSVRFCLDRIVDSLAEISGRLPERCDDEASRTVGRLLADLVYLEPSDLDGPRLSAFLTDALVRCRRIGGLLQSRFALA